MLYVKTKDAEQSDSSGSRSEEDINSQIFAENFVVIFYSMYLIFVMIAMCSLTGLVDEERPRISKIFTCVLVFYWATSACNNSSRFAHEPFLCPTIGYHFYLQCVGQTTNELVSSDTFPGAFNLISSQTLVQCVVMSLACARAGPLTTVACTCA